MRRRISKDKTSKRQSSSLSVTSMVPRSACRSDQYKAANRPKSHNSSQKSSHTVIVPRQKPSTTTVKTASEEKNKNSGRADPISTKDIDVNFYRSIGDQVLKKNKKKNELDRTQDSLSGKQNSDVLIAKGEAKAKFSYLKFMNLHYETIGPGINRIEYTQKDFDTVLRDVYRIFKEESALIDVAPPYTIVGDIHGQFNDLINMFLLLGRPPHQRYLFLGDYVDRGEMSIETIMLLFAYKAYYPEDVILLRGNHECSRVNRHYGFLTECKAVLGEEYGEEIWRRFQDVFNQMPVCALVATKILCMHGGVSPNMTSLDALRNHPKPLKNPSRGVINDLLWSDPDSHVAGYRASARGSGFVFGNDVAEDICKRFDIDVIVRAHQLQMAGFYISPNMRTISMFSAPNYCALFKNAGAMLRVNKELEMHIICMVPESKDCRDRIQIKNVVWDDTVDKIPDWSGYEVVDEQLELDKEAEKPKKKRKRQSKAATTTKTTTTAQTASTE